MPPSSPSAPVFHRFCCLFCSHCSGFLPARFLLSSVEGGLSPALRRGEGERSRERRVWRNGGSHPRLGLVSSKPVAIKHASPL